LSRLTTLLIAHLATLGVETEPDTKLQAVIAAQRKRADTLVELARISVFYYQ
jgi:hypothetical protein